ncbi:protein of unknown function [Methanoculleus bourgensis]|uniref:Uncharacterized protein n=1 Tax=Methanoculleus bourgensis TaxID=83986 RepID=A0A0X3BHL7_9EURY|nr:protein of unknown function [Methanoculleus bourgensis]
MKWPTHGSIASNSVHAIPLLALSRVALTPVGLLRALRVLPRAAIGESPHTPLKVR